MQIRRPTVKQVVLPENLFHRLLAPRVPFLVSSEHEGHRNLAPISNVTSIATEPERVCVAIAHGWTTGRFIELTGEFVLNLLPAELLESLWICGSGYSKISIPSGLSKAEAAGLTLIPSLKVTPQTVAEAVGSIECKVFSKHDVGDHLLFLADIVAAKARSDGWDAKSGAVDLKRITIAMQNASNQFVETGRSRIPNTARAQRTVLKRARNLKRS